MQVQGSPRKTSRISIPDGSGRSKPVGKFEKRARYDVWGIRGRLGGRSRQSHPREIYQKEKFRNWGACLADHNGDLQKHTKETQKTFGQTQRQLQQEKVHCGTCSQIPFRANTKLGTKKQPEAPQRIIPNGRKTITHGSRRYGGYSRTVNGLGPNQTGMGGRSKVELIQHQTTT